MVQEEWLPKRINSINSIYPAQLKPQIDLQTLKNSSLIAASSVTKQLLLDVDNKTSPIITANLLKSRLKTILALKTYKQGVAPMEKFYKIIQQGLNS